MKVWVVQDDEGYDTQAVLGVYASEDKAYELADQEGGFVVGPFEVVMDQIAIEGDD